MTRRAKKTHEKNLSGVVNRPAGVNPGSWRIVPTEKQEPRTKVQIQPIDVDPPCDARSDRKKKIREDENEDQFAFAHVITVTEF